MEKEMSCIQQTLNQVLKKVCTIEEQIIFIIGELEKCCSGGSGSFETITWTPTFSYTNGNVTIPIIPIAGTFTGYVLNKTIVILFYDFIINSIPTGIFDIDSGFPIGYAYNGQSTATTIEYELYSNPDAPLHRFTQDYAFLQEEKENSLKESKPNEKILRENLNKTINSYQAKKGNYSPIHYVNQNFKVNPKARDPVADAENYFTDYSLTSFGRVLISGSGITYQLSCFESCYVYRIRGTLMYVI
jgi:hypothetical protein